MTCHAQLGDVDQLQPGLLCVSSERVSQRLARNVRTQSSWDLGAHNYGANECDK
jgi:hypothetical protein